MSIPNGDYRSPERREHFVYRAWDAHGRLLYVGCTMRPSKREAEHKGDSRWYPLAVRYAMSGPYNYDTARRLEKEAVHAEHPIWNAQEPYRFQIGTIRKRMVKLWFAYYSNWVEWTDAVGMAIRHVDALVPEPPHNRQLSARDVEEARRAECSDALPLRRSA